MFLFPYEQLKKDSDIIIYGAGTAATDYIRQLKKTNYCNVLYAVDRNHNSIKTFPVKVYPPEILVKCNDADYDAVVISIQDRQHALNAKKMLLDYGITEEKIVLSDTGLIGLLSPTQYVSSERDGRLSVCFIAQGGMGDALIASNLVKVFRKLARGDVNIDFYCKTFGVFSGLPFIDNAYPFSLYSDDNAYDVVAFIHRNIYFMKVDIDKLRDSSHVLYEWCINELDVCAEINASIRDDFRASALAVIKGKNRVEQVNMESILPLDRYTPKYMDWNPDKHDWIYVQGLAESSYITVSMSIEDSNADKNPKLWPVSYFNNLVLLIKKHYPKTKIVNIGQDYAFGKIEHTDVDLVGKTDLDELKMILKHSVVHIGVEGGLVHLKNFLNGKSVCLYGPTSRKFFGYDENINLQSKEISHACANGCEGISVHWMSYGCLIDEKPICMEKLYPDYVFSKLKEYLDSLSEFRYTTEKSIPIDCETGVGLREVLLLYLKDNADVALIGRKHDSQVLSCVDVVRSITVYSRNLSVSENDNNCGYMHKISSQKIKAEYGFIYNIPSPDCSYDMVVNYTLQDDPHKQLVVKEMRRVLRDKGHLILLSQDGKCIIEKKSAL